MSTTPAQATYDASMAARGAKHQEVDIAHVYLLQCIEIGTDGVDFDAMGRELGISRDAARMRFNRLRAWIYTATTPPAAQTEGQ